MQENHHARQSAELIKGLLDAARLFSQVAFPGEPFGSRADDLILFAALFVGQTEGRPMNHSKLATYAGLPRPTVIRKIAALMERGAVVKIGDGYALTPSAVDGAAAGRVSKAVGRLLAKAARASDATPVR